MRKLIATGAVVTFLGVAACDDGRQERIPGAEPGSVVPEAEAPWDTLHPPVPPADGMEGPGGGAVPPTSPAAPDVTNPAGEATGTPERRDGAAGAGGGTTGTGGE